jgi:phage shock protein PspC (stress-responsive transcriptional regulator)
MNETPTTPQSPANPDPTSPSGEDPPRRRLLRSRDDRLLAGVAGGIATYLDVDPTLVRVAFVAATLFSGLGLVAYLVFAAVTPNDDGTGWPAERSGGTVWLVVAAVLAGCLLLAGPFWGQWHWGPGWFFGGGLWLLLLIAGAVWIYLTIRDRRKGEDGAVTNGGATAETRALDSTATATAEDRPRRRDGWSRLLKALAIAVAVIIGLNVGVALAGVSAWAAATGHGAIVGGVVIAIGAVLAGAAALGDRRWRWLIVPALVLALPAGAIAASDVRFDGDVGEREYAPASARAIPADGFSLGVGQMTVDLRRLPWRDRDRVPVRTDLGLGQMVIAVPDRVCVDPDVRARAGEVSVRGTRSSGIDAEVIDTPPSGRAPRLLLDADVEAGQIVVTDGPPEAVTDHRRFDGPHVDTDDPRAEARAREACAG